VKPKWRKMAMVVGLLVVALSAFVWWQSWEPEYAGKPLSYWVDQPWTRPGAYSDCQTAIRAIGPKAIPFLMRQARRQESAWQRLHRSIWPKLPAMVQARIPQPQPVNYDYDRCIGAALGTLGPAGLPKLIPALTDRTSGVRLAAIVALSRMNPKPDITAPTVAKLLKDLNGLVRVYAVIVLADMGAVRTQFVPDLTAALKDSDIGPIVPAPKFRSSLFSSGPPPTAATVVTYGVAVRGNAALVLGLIGSEARSAVPDLHKLLTDSDRYTRTQAAIAL
jgi:HEAT repeats